MLEAIIQDHKQLSNFLSVFRRTFKNSPKYRHFQACVIGLIIYLGSRNLAGISRSIPDGKSAGSLYRFMAEMNWDMEGVHYQSLWVLDAPVNDKDGSHHVGSRLDSSLGNLHGVSNGQQLDDYIGAPNQDDWIFLNQRVYHVTSFRQA